MKTFSKKEALGHGFAMTRKYFGVIAIFGLIYLMFGIVEGVMDAAAGKDEVTDTEIRQLYDEPARVEAFKAYLMDADYIDQRGGVQRELAFLRQASELNLPPEWEGDRERIFEFLKPYTYRLPFPLVVYFLLSIGFFIISILLQIGFLKVFIKMSRDEQPETSDLFSGGPLLIKFILGGICCGLIVMFGMVLLIIPGIILMMMLQMYAYLIVDKGMGPVESLKESRVITKGSRWQLFWFGGLILLVNLGGLLCLGVGLIATMPATSIAFAYVYDRLLEARGGSGQEGAEGLAIQ